MRYIIFFLIISIFHLTVIGQHVTAFHDVQPSGEPNSYTIKTTVKGLEGVDIARITYLIDDTHTYSASPNNSFFSDRNEQFIKFYIMAVPSSGELTVEFGITLKDDAEYVFPVEFQYSKNEVKQSMKFPQINISGSQLADNSNAHRDEDKKENSKEEEDKRVAEEKKQNELEAEKAKQDKLAEEKSKIEAQAKMDAAEKKAEEERLAQEKAELKEQAELEAKKQAEDLERSTPPSVFDKPDYKGTPDKYRSEGNLEDNVMLDEVPDVQEVERKDREEAAKKQKEESLVNTSTSDTKYSIQILALSKFSQTRLNTFVKKHNLDANLIVKRKVGNWTKISYGRLKNKDEARAMIQTLHRNHNISEGFLITLGIVKK